MSESDSPLAELVQAASLEGLTTVFVGGKPANDALKKALRKSCYAQLGAAGRKAVSERVLRVTMLQATLLCELGKDAPQAGAYPPLFGKKTASALLKAMLAHYEESRVGKTDAPVHVCDKADGLACKHSVPAWLVDHVLSSPSKFAGGAAEVEAYLSLLNAPADVFLRVNRHVFSTGGIQGMGDVIASLLDDGIDVTEHPLLPGCLRIKRSTETGKANVKGSRMWQEGVVEVQDVGSQIIGSAFSVSKRPAKRKAAGDDAPELPVILDYCCGLGGKALQFASAHHATHRVVAADISTEAMRELPHRSERCGLAGRVTPQVHPLEAELKAEVVFVDAPCSGLGRMRRRPDNRWRFDPAWLASYCATQKEVITKAAAHVAPGGYLVYATCTFNRAENEDIVDAFLASPEGAAFEGAPLSEVYSPQMCEHLGVGDGAYCTTLYPHLQDSDGFFVSRLRLKD